MKGLDNQLEYDSHIGDDEIKNGFSIIDIIENGEEFSEQDLNLEELDELIREEVLYQDEECVYDNYNDCESCVNCYYSDGKYCPVKNIYINKSSPLCWSYRDCLTMRVSNCFQDDDYDLD